MVARQLAAVQRAFTPREKREILPSTRNVTRANSMSSNTKKITANTAGKAERKALTQ